MRTRQTALLGPRGARGKGRGAWNEIQGKGNGKELRLANPIVMLAIVPPVGFARAKR